MGISTLQSYQGAQIFEIIGLNKYVVDKYFTGATSRIEGMGLDEIARKRLPNICLPSAGRIFLLNDCQQAASINGNGKENFISSIRKPFTCCNIQLRMNDYASFKKYSKLVNDQMRKSRYPQKPVSVQTEPRLPFRSMKWNRQKISMRRFATGAMSFGSISHEAHSTLAIAMNRHWRQKQYR